MSQEIWQGNYTQLYIDGAWTDPATADVLTVVSPFTEQPIAQVPAGSAADIDRAVAAARRAFDDGPWASTTLAERIEAVRRLRASVFARHDRIAELVTAEMGCTITQSRAMQAPGATALMDMFLEHAPRHPWSQVRPGPVINALVTREPVGVVAAIVPWNSPFVLSILKIAPALIAGCTVVLKPPPEAPLDAYLLAEAVIEANLPPGVVNIVPADRGPSEHLVKHPGVDKVSFTGSTVAGCRIAALCGADLRRVSLELGGKSAALVLDDADLDVVIASVRALSLRYNGQACNNKTRIVVSPRRKDELLERLAEMAHAMPVGDPADPATAIGPLVSARQRARVESYIASGLAQGARLVVGGGRPAHLPQGWFVETTVFTEVEPHMTIAQEEIFGPVLSVLTADTEDRAVAIANDSAYGLNGSVFSADEEHALAVARRIRTGTVEVNGRSAGFGTPIGGFKKSGIGREAGPEGFDEYVEFKSFGLSAELAATLT